MNLHDLKRTYAYPDVKPNAPDELEMVKRLHMQLIDLRTSIQHKRHHDDLLSEIDDILYGLRP